MSAPFVPFIPPGPDDDSTIRFTGSATTASEIDSKSYLMPLKAYQYRPDKGAWRHVSTRKNDLKAHHPTSIKLITWNVDFQNPYTVERLSAILRHLETAVFKCQDGESPEPCCVMLQELHAEALPSLLEDEWVRNHFIVTPISAQKWPIYYGNVTLVSKSLVVVRAQILRFGYSTMGRTGLMVDVRLRTPTAAADSREVTLRLINTHLESLPPGAYLRHEQLSVLESFLSKDKEVKGGVIAGDMNAICPTDLNLALDVGLRDAWKKGDEEDSGFTWGYQGSGADIYPAGRLDKVLYAPRKGYRVDEPKRIGIGLKAKKGVLLSWASDHYGLEAILRVLR